MAKTKSDKLTIKHIVGYGCGDCGGSITLWMVAGFMTRFLQVHMQVNAGILATMLLIWNIWDAVNDPLMGTIMDMCFAKAKPGADKFRPWILASIPIIAVGLISFFVVPPMLGGGFAMIAAAFILKIVYELGYTMMNIGMGSLLGNMSKNDAERATLSSARGFGSTFAQLIGGALIPACLAKFGDNAAGYGKTSVVIAIVGCFIIFLHYALTEERNKGAVAVEEKTAEEKEAEKIKVTDIFNIITKNRAFLALVLHSISIIRVCLLGGFGVLACTLAYTLMIPETNAWVFIIANSIGSGLITMSVQMQWGLVAESIDYNEYLTGKRNEGTIYGFFSLSRRIGSTIANSASVLIIAGIGYDAALTAAGLPQADSTIAGIKLMVIGFPMVAALCSFCCFTFIWNINSDVRAKMAEWKAAKAAK